MPAPKHSIFNRPDALPDAQPTVSNIESKGTDHNHLLNLQDHALSQK